MTRRRHLRLIPGDAPHVLLLETSEVYVHGEVTQMAEVICTCGEQWTRMNVAFLEALAEHHEGALFA